MKKVTVIGSGSWGTALAVMLAENGHEVFIWSRRQDAVDELLKERTNKKYLPRRGDSRFHSGNHRPQGGCGRRGYRDSGGSFQSRCTNRARFLHPI